MMGDCRVAVKIKKLTNYGESNRYCQGYCLEKPCRTQKPWYVITALGMSSRVYANGHIKE